MNTCPICGSSCRDYDEYRRCVKCGVVRTIYHYDSTIYKSGYANTYVAYQQTPVNIPLNLFRLGLVSRWLTSDKSILDIGCCIGEFIRFAEHYYTCYGYEPNEFARTLARKRVTSPVHATLNGQVPKVNAITMFDVLEHIEEPVTFLALLMKNYLVDKGIIAITTPNVEVIPPWNIDGMKAWKHYKPKEHLFLYTEQGLQIMFERLGFEVIHWGREESDIRPGNPDGDLLSCIARKI